MTCLNGEEHFLTMEGSTNQGIHHLDLIKYLVGDISSVYCKMDTLGAKLEVEIQHYQ